MKNFLNKNYERETWINFLQKQFLPDDFFLRKEKIDIDFKSKYIKPQAYWIGDCESLGDLAIIEIAHSKENDPRIGVSRDAFRLMAQHGLSKALFFFISDNSNNYRFSLITLDLKLEGKDVKYKFSNPKRFSFFLGEEAKIHTPAKFLFEKGRIKDFDDLQSRFSIEVVNKEFYHEIQRLFYKLVGGKVKQGSKKFDFTPMLKLPSTNDHQTMQEFSVRLVGRLVFCWFLKKKKSGAGIPLIPENILSSNAIETNYYHNTIEPLFFELLNTPIEERRDYFRNSEFDLIPFLNGGLFDPNLHEDYYQLGPDGKTYYLNTLKIPDEWLKEFITLLETYNFTIDENTSIDIDLSVDPEMLGRIFENLLAEINPETGNTARKATGSYYTPRPIVEYMVDESLIQYLLTKLSPKFPEQSKNLAGHCEKSSSNELPKQSQLEKQIRELLDYNIEETELTKEQKIAVIDALDEIKVLDPACGSGAFPMGILQKMLLILQKVDPESIEWVIRQLDKIPNPLVRKALEDKLMNENWKYKHKMGIIQNAIYGVDIQPIATEISKLRLFLTLIVDENIIDEKANRNIHPLPNLSFKFVTANTLIGLPKAVDNEQMDLMNFDNVLEPLMNKLEDLREQFFYASGAEKNNIEKNFIKTQNEIGQFQAENASTNKKATALVNWNPFEDKASDWFDPSWMFGIKNGFDIVIGNPPYLGEKGHKEIFRPIVEGNLRKFYHRKMDLFYFFIHISLEIGNKNSICTFITTNYYITATSAIKLRNDIKNRTDIVSLLNFNELRIFDSAQGQHNMITILKKSHSNTISQNFITSYNGFLNSRIFEDILNKQDQMTEYFSANQSELYYNKENYIRMGIRNIDKILDKMLINNLRLGEICKINMGIQTAADFVNKRLYNIATMNDLNINLNEGIYILDDKEISYFSDLEKQDICKIYVKNTAISKYHINLKNHKWLLYVDSKVNIDDYPNIKNHLSKYKKLLLSREQVENKDAWFWIRGAKRNFLINTGKHIMCPYRSKHNSFALSDGEIFGAGDVYFITQSSKGYKLKYILGLLNSKLLYKWFYYRGKRKGETLELYQKPLTEIPIASASPEGQNEVVTIVDSILQMKVEKKDTQHHENQIDLMVYKLYELTYEEAKIVDPELDKVLSQFGLSKEDYEKMSVEELGELR